MSSEVEQKKTKVLNAANKLIECTHGLYGDYSNRHLEYDKKYPVANGKVIMFHQKSLKAYDPPKLFYIYEDDKVRIVVRAGKASELRIGWLPYSISLIRRRFLSRSLENVFTSKYSESEIEVFRVGQWCDYVIQLAETAERALQEKRERLKQELLRDKGAKQKLRQELNKPVDDSDMFSK